MSSGIERALKKIKARQWEEREEGTPSGKGSVGYEAGLESKCSKGGHQVLGKEQQLRTGTKLWKRSLCGWSAVRVRQSKR